jgi:hypothetical protein
MFNPSFDEDKKIVSGIYDAAKDAFLAPGRLMQPNPYPPGSEEASWYEDQRQKAMVPAAVNIAALLAGFGLPMAERGAVGALGGRLPRSPASRAAEKGFADISTTPKGGPAFAETDHLYPAEEGQQSVVKMRLTGGRKADVNLANELGGFAEKPKGYVWHHVDDFDPQTGTSTLELVDEDAHQATLPHTGSVSQYEKFHGIRYKR